MVFLWVGLFEIAALIRWLIPSKAKYYDETDREEVLWRKGEKNLEKGVKSAWNCYKENR